MPRRSFNPQVHTRNKTGKLVSKARSQQHRQNPWAMAVAAARKELNLKGFVPIKKDTELYRVAQSIYKGTNLAGGYRGNAGKQFYQANVDFFKATSKPMFRANENV